jgi:hypothetical protein
MLRSPTVTRKLVSFVRFRAPLQLSTVTSGRVMIMRLLILQQLPDGMVARNRRFPVPVGPTQ